MVDRVMFEKMYGAGSYDRAMHLVNELAPNTRRDDWWAGDGPYEIIGRALVHGSHGGSLVCKPAVLDEMSEAQRADAMRDWARPGYLITEPKMSEGLSRAARGLPPLTAEEVVQRGPYVR